MTRQWMEEILGVIPKEKMKLEIAKLNQIK